MTDTKPIEGQIAYAQMLVNDGLYPEYASAILASLKELQNIKSQPVPVEPECPSPEHTQHIQFEGCDCVVISPETYEEITVYIDSLQSALQVAQQERDEWECKSGQYMDERDKTKASNKRLVELLKALLGALKHPVPPSQKQWDAIGVVSDNILLEVGK